MLHVLFLKRKFTIQLTCKYIWLKEIVNTVDIDLIARANIELHFQMILYVTKRVYPTIFSREKYEKDAATGENVTFGCGFDIVIVSAKFWRHPQQSTFHSAHGTSVSVADSFAQSKIRQFELLAIHRNQNVIRFNVAVNKFFRVDVIKTVSDLV